MTSYHQAASAILIKSHQFPSPHPAGASSQHAPTHHGTVASWHSGTGAQWHMELPETDYP